MTKEFWYWLFLILWPIVGAAAGWKWAETRPFLGVLVIVWILLFLNGLHDFGSPLK